MTTPLIPIGGAALGTLAWQAMRNLKPGDFLSELLSGITGPAQGPPETPSVRANTDLSQELPTLAKTLHVRFLAAGVDLSEPIALKDDGHGEIIVDGDHRHRDVIEQLLAGDGPLRSAFLTVAAAATAERERVTDGLSLPGEFRLRLERGAASVEFE